MRIHELPEFRPSTPSTPPTKESVTKPLEGVITQLPPAKAKDFIDLPDDVFEEDEDEVQLAKAIKHLSTVIGLLDAILMSEHFTEVFKDSKDQKEVIDTIIDVNQFLMDFPDLDLE